MPFFIFLAFICFSPLSASAQDTLRIVALGDSLTSGYGLEGGEDFASKLQEALIKDGIMVKVENAGVSGDTSAGGLERLDWATQGDQNPDLVIVALGANDMLRAIDPDVTKKNLAAILEQLKTKNIPTLLVGMKSPVNMGSIFGGRFNKIYSELAKEYDVAFYPFFLRGVAMKQELNLPDGIHPNQKGIAMMVDNLLPEVKNALLQ